MIDVREHTTKVEQEAARVAAGSPVPTTGPSFPLPTLPLTHTHTHTHARCPASAFPCLWGKALVFI
jgi:hypothetical protein